VSKHSKWEKLEMRGSVTEAIPQYNHFFNGCKEKVFPLQEIHKQIADDRFYKHTKKVLKEPKKRRIFSAGKEYEQKVIGSKFRFVEAWPELNESEPEDKNPGESFDVDLYLEDVAEDSAELERREVKRIRNKEFFVTEKKEAMQRKMEKELTQNSFEHRHKMIGRIVRSVKK